MDSKRPSPPRETFIIRLWQRESDPTRWLGQVQHVGSSKTAAINHLDELTAVVQQLIKQPDQHVGQFCKSGSDLENYPTFTKEPLK